MSQSADTTPVTPIEPVEVHCHRCNSACPPPDLDDCLGCNSKSLCPACMLAHNCSIRARQAHFRRYDLQRSILQ